MNPEEAKKLLSQSMGDDASVPNTGDLPGVAGYRDLAVVGRGGMGLVYRAECEETGETVAIKVFHPYGSADPLGLERFDREGDMMQALQHPRLLTIRERGELADGRPFLITDFALGGTVRELLEHEEVLDEDRVRQLVHDLCEGLQALHEQGLVHRDIKPSNLLLDAEGRILIGDFGLAKDLSAEMTELTLSGTTLGTASYMAPEQGQADQSIDKRADIFSLGVVTYELLTGKLPKGQFPKPSELGRSKSWDQFVAICLATQPEDRAQDVKALLWKLEARPKPSLTRRLLIGAGVAAVGGLGVKLMYDQRWTDLMSKFSPSAPWSRDSEGNIRCSPQQAATIFSTNRGSGIYALRLKWRRLSGNGSLAVFLPTTNGWASFEMGAWQEDLVGIQSIGGDTLQSPNSQAIRMPFENDREYRIDLLVSGGAIRIKIDGEQLAHIFPEDQPYSIVPVWRVGNREPTIGLGAWDCEAVFRDIEFMVM